MRVAVIGSRGLHADIAMYMPADTTEIVTGGASCVGQPGGTLGGRKSYPQADIACRLQPVRKAAPLWRNRMIVEIVDCVVVVWDGRSHSTKYTIDYA